MKALRELRPALDDGEIARESGSAPALSFIPVRGSFRFHEESGHVIATTSGDQARAERDDRIDRERAELLRLQRDVLADRRRR